MTHSPTPAERLAIKTANAAVLNSPDASVDIVATVVFALGAAGLLMNPETAAELNQSRPVDEDPITYSLTPEALHAASGAVIEVPPRAEDVSRQVTELRNLLAGQRAAVEDPHDSPLHHTYDVGRDLPEVTR